MAIKNRYEFMYYVACTDSNPNGDPDMGNTPRMDPQTMQGYISDVSTKRLIRNYVSMAREGEPGLEIIVQQSTNMNRQIARAKRESGVDDCAKTKEAVYAGRKKACELFYDVRTFGAVMSTGPNAGQVRGPVQITFGRSMDPILPLDLSITRMAVTDSVKGKELKLEDYVKMETEKSADELQTIGRKQLIPFGLYEIRGFISANLAAETGFDDEDLQLLFEAIMNMYEHNRSSSKGEMEVVSPLIIFKHVGTDSDEKQRMRQAKLGCAPAHKLFELVNVKKREDVVYPRKYKDYDARIDLKHIPTGVEVGFKEDAFSDIVWGSLPKTEEWLKNE